MFIQTEATPNPEVLKFLPGREVLAEGSRDFRSVEEAAVSPLAAAVGGRGPGPLVASLAKEGVQWGARKVPVTLVPGDLTDEEIAELA